MSNSPNPDTRQAPDARQGYGFDPIAYVRSPFGEKFGIPRQPGLAPSAIGQVQLLPPYDLPEALDGLEQVSHIWLIWLFHQIPPGNWHPRVRPPRLGGNRSLGVFASRSMFRPNPIGLSLVRLESISREPGRLYLEISGLDLLDGTPILDIKPYLPYSDSIPDAYHHLAAEAPEAVLELEFAADALQTLASMERQEAAGLKRLLQEILCLDPRPAYRHGQFDSRKYGMRLLGREVRWSMNGLDRVIISEIGERE